MRNRPERMTVTGRARPLRVAYLVDLTDCPDALLDAIFAECYSRWGGRRTLIVPATSDGIDVRYGEWLWYFDPDVVYSFVNLTDAVVATFHERYAPAHLTHHRELGIKADEPRRFRIKLPLQGLSSLSVLPTFISRSWGFEGPPKNIKLLSKYWDSDEARFLAENFGLVSTSFASGTIATSHPDLFSCLTIITQDALENPRFGKDKNAIYVTSEDKALEALGQGSGLLTLTQLSEFFAPHLDLGNTNRLDGMSLIAGDSVSDRLLFWNGHHHYDRPSFSEITSLRLSAAKLDDAEFLSRIRQIIARRGVHGHNSRNDHITLRSCSLDQSVLEAAAERLRRVGQWLSVRVARNKDHAETTPLFPKHHHIAFRWGTLLAEPEGRAVAEFDGKQVPVPLAMPWHMREALPPAGLRQGNWMIELTIQRIVDHSRYSNLRDIWVLPRRLRLDRMFNLQRDVEYHENHGDSFLRPMRDGMIATALNTGITRAVISIPDDLDALRAAICSNIEWPSFDVQRKDAPQAQLRFKYAEPSDKGRYLIGVLQLFETVPDAFSVLMNGYWHDILQQLGGVPTEKDMQLRDLFVRTLRKRLGKPSGPMTLESSEQLNRLAKEALRIGRMAGREQRYVSYEALKTTWESLVKDYLRKIPESKGQDDDSDVCDASQLDLSIQHLCLQEILFQGREWRCRSCFNRNWIGIDDLGRALTCEVCGRNEPAPVSGDWHFRANPFIIEAYREHGVEAVVWALWQLSEKAQHSFYFASSLKLWVTYPKQVGSPCDAEIDALVVVDGLVYLVEAKNSAGLDESEISQLVMAAERIRPNVVFIASMGGGNSSPDDLIENLKSKLPSEISIEVRTFDDKKLDRHPFLPR